LLDIEEINNTIEQLENGATTFDSCLKLASLYICKDKIEKAKNEAYSTSNSILKEYNDILPQYKLYCEVKRKYQLQELTENAVELSIKDVCKEINEFIHTLYSNTDMQVERDCIKGMLKDLGDTL
jgi:hypothetical protein